MHSHILIHVVKGAPPGCETLHMSKCWINFVSMLKVKLFSGDGIHDIKRKLEIIDFFKSDDYEFKFGLDLKNQSSL